ncbi:MAG: SsrA-binding protein SmpB [Tissierellia bacterium]|nr:SsrA-binding protein SmpB [Tissierellia bacterium]
MVKERKNLATNRKARHEYFIEDIYEAGLELKGTEVKSIRQGKVNISDAFISIDNLEAFVENMHVSPYEQGNIFNVDPLRKRKLLLHKREIYKLEQQLKLKGYTLIPLNLYLKSGKVKMELAVAKGKKLYDKRDAMAKKDSEMNIKRALKDLMKE